MQLIFTKFEESFNNDRHLLGCKFWVAFHKVHPIDHQPLDLLQALVSYAHYHPSQCL